VRAEAEKKADKSLISFHFNEIDQYAKKAIYQEMLDRVELFK